MICEDVEDQGVEDGMKDFDIIDGSFKGVEMILCEMQIMGMREGIMGEINFEEYGEGIEKIGDLQKGNEEMWMMDEGMKIEIWFERRKKGRKIEG